MESPETAPIAAPPQSPAAAEPNEAGQKRLARRSRLLGGLVYAVARTIYQTIRLHCENLERVPPDAKGLILGDLARTIAHPGQRLQTAGLLGIDLAFRRRRVQNNIFSRLGYQTIRGSTGRGGFAAPCKWRVS